MQRIGADSIQAFMRASRVERRALVAGLGEQVRHDLRKQAWKVLQRRGVPVARARGREDFLVMVGDDSISQTLYVYGECDFDNVEKAHVVLGRTQGSRLLVDVGANVGSICIPAVARGFAERAIAIEPEPLNHSLLTLNIRLNRLENRVSALQAAVGDGASDALVMVLNPANLGDHQVVSVADVTGGSATVSVPSVTLDVVGEELEADSDLIWMDIQGYEGHALAGATGVLARAVPLVMEFWPIGLVKQGTSVSDLTTLLAAYEYWYDLSEEAPRARPLAALTARWQELIEERDGRYYVDVLFV